MGSVEYEHHTWNTWKIKKVPFQASQVLSVGSVTQKPKSREVTMYAVCLLKGHQTSQQRAMSSDTSKLDCEKMFGRVGGILKNRVISCHCLQRPKKNPLTQPRMLLQTLSSRIFVVGFEQGWGVSWYKVTPFPYGGYTWEKHLSIILLVETTNQYEIWAFGEQILMISLSSTLIFGTMCWLIPMRAVVLHFFVPSWKFGCNEAVSSPQAASRFWQDSKSGHSISSQLVTPAG